MDFLVFLLYYFICTLILGLIIFLIIKLFIKKKCFTFSKLAEKEIDKYFNAYDNLSMDDVLTSIELNKTINELTEGMNNNDDSINR